MMKSMRRRLDRLHLSLRGKGGHDSAVEETFSQLTDDELYLVHDALKRGLDPQRLRPDFAPQD